jgi:hypothetical protein
MKSDNDILLKIKEWWNEDSKMDMDQLHQEALKIPMLHAKYLNEHSLIRQIRITKEYEKKILKFKLYNHFTGKELMAERPSALKKVTGSENIQMHIETDGDMIRINTQIDYLNMTIDYINEILKMIHNRSFQIKHAIDYQKFQSGMDI